MLSIVKNIFYLEHISEHIIASGAIFHISSDFWRKQRDLHQECASSNDQIAP